MVTLTQTVYSAYKMLKFRTYPQAKCWHFMLHIRVCVIDWKIIFVSFEKGMS